ncbi:MFS transporter [Asanoa siamensis]|uniref:MFS-type transporter y4rN n=1 Tax=Asanoa siamensis TaxID=926357 RepID=A0ABQ4D3X9_9ACTN|nr:MFS transporter [Asanoa siamensis]GIF77827.1 putative MFS-type transporter y4rN [Asanoa siamensis]
MADQVAISGSRIERPGHGGLPAPVRIATAVTLLANSADTFLLFLLLWLAQPQGWSSVQTAVVVLVLRLPTLAVGALMGRAVDKWGARPVVLFDVSARAALLLLLASSVRSSSVPFSAVLVLGGLCGALSPATYAAIRWLVPRLVPAGQLTRANATVALGDQMPLLIGTALVGPSFTMLGVGGSVLLAAGMLVCAVSLALLLPQVPPDASPEAVGGEINEGRRGRTNWPPRVVAVIALSTAYYLAYGPFETASPEFVRAQLSAGEGTYSLLWGLFGIGALASLPIAPLLAKHRPGVVNALGAMAWGLVMLPLAFTDNIVTSAALFLIGGLAWGPYTTVETTALQRWINPARHGLVFGLQRSLLATATPVGAALGALALDFSSAAGILAVSAATCAAAGVIALVSRDLRKAR